MSIDDVENIDSLCAGDAHILRNIPQEDMAAANGTIFSICLSDGKVMQNLFSFMKQCPEIYIQCNELGFSFIGVYTNKQNKGNIYSEDQKPSMVFYKTFKKDKIPEYFFCPDNLKLEMPDGKNILTLSISMNQIITLMKKTKPKASTNLRFELNGKTGNLSLCVFNGANIPYTLTYQWSRVITGLVPDKIVNPNLSPCFKFSAEIFCQIINNAASKSDNVAYDYKIAIHKGGIASQTDAPSVGPIIYGTMTHNPHVFELSHESTKYFGLIHKITPRATILMTSVDDTVFKVTYPIGSFGEGYIFQFPKNEQSPLQWQQPQPQMMQQQWQQPNFPQVPQIMQQQWQQPNFQQVPQMMQQQWQQPNFSQPVQGLLSSSSQFQQTESTNSTSSISSTSSNVFSTVQSSIPETSTFDASKFTPVTSTI